MPRPAKSRRPKPAPVASLDERLRRLAADTSQPEAARQYARNMLAGDAIDSAQVAAIRAAGEERERAKKTT